LAVCAVLLLPTSTIAGGEVNFFFGKKDIDDAEPADDQTEFGAAFNIGVADWPVSLAVDILQSSDDAEYSYSGYYSTYKFNLDVEVLEVDLGVRKLFLEDKIQPYLGGGLVYADLDVEVTFSGRGVSEGDSGVGLWANAGVLFRVGERFNVGIDVRHSDVEVTLEDVDVDVGGTHYGVLFGFRWGE
jgi:hypothetical protein